MLKFFELVILFIRPHRREDSSSLKSGLPSRGALIQHGGDRKTGKKNGSAVSQSIKCDELTSDVEISSN